MAGEHLPAEATVYLPGGNKRKINTVDSVNADEELIINWQEANGRYHTTIYAQGHWERCEIKLHEGFIPADHISRPERNINNISKEGEVNGAAPVEEGMYL